MIKQRLGWDPYESVRIKRLAFSPGMGAGSNRDDEESEFDVCYMKQLKHKSNSVKIIVKIQDGSKDGCWNIDGELRAHPQNSTMHLRVHPRLVQVFGCGVEREHKRARTWCGHYFGASALLQRDYYIATCTPVKQSLRDTTTNKSLAAKQQPKQQQNQS